MSRAREAADRAHTVDEEVAGALAAIRAGAAANLDTLSEIAAALGGDPAFAATMIAALAAKAPLAGPTGSGTATWPTINASSALQKAGVAGQLVSARAQQLWSVGFTTTSTVDVEAWISAEIVKTAPTATPARALLQLVASADATRAAAGAGVALTLEVATKTGAVWDAWQTVGAERPIYGFFGGSGSASVQGGQAWVADLDLTGKSAWRARLLARNTLSGSTPSATLAHVALTAQEIV